MKIIKTKRKTISISVDSKGLVTVRCPKNMPNNEILSFIEKHKKWIDKKVNEKKLILEQNCDILSCKVILLLGQKYKTVYVNGLNEIYISGNEIFIPFKYSKKIKEHLRNFYVKQFYMQILPKLNNLIDRVNKKVNNITLIKSTRRWGMCDTSNNLSFNYKIMCLPQELIDYILVHEVCHLFEMNHSKKFYNLINQIIPNYKILISKLKECGFLLREF